ncbi:hypothetical protein [Cryptosporangium minutisporangium]|uniref:Uncharacterized protein n=1 Tax=Cryptosporangium minutisporangium TaxID=113569 RepID=A0ABP6T118_9ACTN
MTDDSWMELDQAAAWLVGQFRPLLTELTGAAGQDVRLPPGPAFAPWDESLWFCDDVSADDRVALLRNVDLVERVWSTLASAGWTVRVRCPECGEALIALTTTRRSGRELWWECGACGWLGVQYPEDQQLRRMRRLEGAESDCVFCGEDGTNAASCETYEYRGERADWLVCLYCGRSHTRLASPES